MHSLSRPGKANLLGGAAELVISPPVGAPTLGTIQRSTGVHDDLYARALVLNDGRQRVAILSLDLIGMDFVLSDQIRECDRRSYRHSRCVCPLHSQSFRSIHNSLERAGSTLVCRAGQGLARRSCSAAGGSCLGCRSEERACASCARGDRRFTLERTGACHLTRAL